MPIVVKDIQVFTESSKGKGRTSNDSNNSLRETILGDLLGNKYVLFMNDPEFGHSWTELQTKWRNALHTLATKCGHEGFDHIDVVKRGGRKYNWDIDVIYVYNDGSKKVERVEFKFGGSSVNTLPEFFNPAANKPFHQTTYAEFFHTYYLQNILDLYGLSDKPSLDQYKKYVHQNNCKKLPMFAQLKALTSDAERNVQREAISHRSIHEYLELVMPSTNLSVITDELRRSQEGKHFLIYNNGTGDFSYDSIHSDELTMNSVVGISNKNTLVLQTMCPTTQIRMLLRWKNYQCILYPAWQISMVRRLKAL